MKTKTKIKSKKNTKKLNRNNKLTKFSKKNLKKHKSKKKHRGGGGCPYKITDGSTNQIGTDVDTKINDINIFFNVIFDKNNINCYIFDIQYLYRLLGPYIENNFQDYTSSVTITYHKYDEYVNDITKLNLIYEYLEKRETELNILDINVIEKKIDDLCKFLEISNNTEELNTYRIPQNMDRHKLLLLLEILSIIKIELEVNDNIYKSKKINLHDMILKYLKYVNKKYNNTNIFRELTELTELLKLYDNDKYTKILNSGDNQSNIAYVGPAHNVNGEVVNIEDFEV
jgi:hypothetical protein